MERRTMLNLPGGFGKVERIRNDASAQLRRDRHARRTANFNNRRNITEEDIREAKVLPPQTIDEKVINRKLALQKYKEDKEARKKAMKEKQKPPFKVGIPHHGSSPVLREVTNENLMRPKNQRKNQPEFNFQVNRAVVSTKKLTSPQTPTVLKRSAQKMPLGGKPREIHPSVNAKRTKSSVVSEPLAVPLPNEVCEDDVFAQDTEVEIKEIKNSPQTPISSPKTRQNNEALTQRTHTVVTPPIDYIAIKHSPTEESSVNQAVRCDSNLMSELNTQRRKKVNPVNKTPDSESNSEPERIKEVALHRGRLDVETGRLLGLAEQWEALALQEFLPTDVRDEVDSVVGQTKLLTRDKFNQFRGLVDQFERKEGLRPITVDDLNGFWDMVYIQVEVLSTKYGKLQALRENNWVEKEEFKKKAHATKKTKRINKPSSSVRKFLIDKRVKALESSNETNPEHSVHVTTENSVVPQVSSMQKRTRSYSPSPYIAMRLSEAGRLSVSSPKVEVIPNGSPKSILRQRIKPKIDSLKKVMPLNVSSERLGENKEELLEKTPRRSMRLINKTPTPLKDRLCRMCASLYCSKSDCKKAGLRTAERSRRKILSPTDQPDASTTETTCPGAVDPSKSSGSGTRFVLQPSKLEAVVHLGAIPKTRMSKRIKGRESKVSSSPLLEGLEDNAHSTRKVRVSSNRRNGTPK